MKIMKSMCSIENERYRGESANAPKWPPTTSLMTPADRALPTRFLSAWDGVMAETCHAHKVWQGRFVQALSDTNGSVAQAFALSAVWATNMVVGSYCFPRYVAALAARAEQDAVRHGLLENAWDESGGYAHSGRSHFWLAVRLARLLGLTDAEIEKIRPIPEAVSYTDEHYFRCVTGDFGFALGMISLIEEFTTPEFTLILEAFLRSCATGIGIDQSRFILMGGAEYFTANISDDERHRQEMPRLVAGWLLSRGVDLCDLAQVSRGLQAVRAGAARSSDLRDQFFDGIYRFVKGGGCFRDLATG
jgi:pyrroloquinoline quinone (PQQ) biosynthesis protein C